MIVNRETPVALPAEAETPYAARPNPTGLAEVVEIILDKGLVIDAYVRVSLVGIELLTIDARIVVASVDTYLRFAEAAERLDLRQKSQALRLSSVVMGPEGDSMGENVGESIVDRAINRMTADDDDGDGDDDKK